MAACVPQRESYNEEISGVILAAIPTILQARIRTAVTPHNRVDWMG